MALRGGPELRARLNALKLAFKPLGREWAEDTVRNVRPKVPVRTGKGRASVRVRNASQTKASVSANYYVAILDKGSKPYDIQPRKASTLAFDIGGRTIFSKKVHKPRQAPMGFAAKAAKDALEENAGVEQIINEWNRAA